MRTSSMGTSKGFVLSYRSACPRILKLPQANILITNDDPPRACLADFGFTTVVPDPESLVSPILELEGGTVVFMAPELLAPSKYGLTGAVPTREADIYAFGLVIFQVLVSDCRPLPSFDIPAGANWRATISRHQTS